MTRLSAIQPSLPVAPADPVQRLPTVATMTTVSIQWEQAAGSRPASGRLCALKVRRPPPGEAPRNSVTLAPKSIRSRGSSWRRAHLWPRGGEHSPVARSGEHSPVAPGWRALTLLLIRGWAYPTRCVQGDLHPLPGHLGKVQSQGCGA